MTTKTEMHSYLEFWQPDQIAECWDGVSVELYSYLWNELVPQYDDRPRGEAPGEVTYGIGEWWDDIPGPLKEELNRLAAAEDAKWEN